VAEKNVIFNGGTHDPEKKVRSAKGRMQYEPWILRTIRHGTPDDHGTF
jgi:hypothetical protein